MKSKTSMDNKTWVSVPHGTITPNTLLGVWINPGEEVIWHKITNLSGEMLITGYEITNKSIRYSLREELDNLAHQQWSDWMEYLFDKSKSNGDGTFTIPEWAVERWTRQMNTDYNDLSKEEKDSDRKEADKFIDVIKRHKDII